LYWLQLPFLVKGISGHQMSIIGFLSSQTTFLSKQNTMLNCILGAYMCFKFSAFQDHLSTYLFLLKFMRHFYSYFMISNW
jgi:hypothetical protein